MRPSPGAIAINVNFDSLNEAFGFPTGFRDPSFFEPFDRFEALAARHGAKLTLFMIGRDMESPEVFARVRDWAGAGHEIANHTWSHPMSLGAMSESEIADEIGRCHDIIARATGREPRGFTAPAWSTSRAVMKELLKRRYLYDASLFPSCALYPMVARIALNHWHDPKRLRQSLSRRDWGLALMSPRDPFLASADWRPARADQDAIVVLPLPTVSRLDVPLWHTVGYVLGWSRHESIFRRVLAESEAPYYLLHPADFVAAEEVPQGHSHALERLSVPGRTKLERLASALALARDSGRVFVTMDELAAGVRARAGRSA